MSWRNYRIERLKGDYELLIYLSISFFIFSTFAGSMDFLYARSQKVAEEFGDFTMINLPPPSPVINPQLENLPPPEVEDMNFKAQYLLPPAVDESVPLAEGAIGKEGTLPEDLMVEEKMASELNSLTEKLSEELKTPLPIAMPKREKSDAPMKNLLANRTGTTKKTPPGGSAASGQGAAGSIGSGQKTFGRGEFGLGDGGGAMLGSKSGFGRGGAGSSPFGRRISGAGLGSDIKEGSGRKSKKTIRIAIIAYVLADGKVDVVEYAGAVGVDDLEPADLSNLIEIALEQIRNKQYEPSNEPMRKIRDELDFDYMGKETE